jgi:thymidine phosphorylase
VVELTVALAREMLELAGRPDADVEEALRDGRAMDAWRRMIRAQDGDPDAPLPAPAETHTVVAPREGYVTRLDAYAFGVAAWRLGAGRARAEDPVLHSAGIDLHARPGDRVVAGQPLFTLGGPDDTRFARALEALDAAWELGESAPERAPLVRERIAATS